MSDPKPTRLLPPTYVLASIVLMITADRFLPVWQLWDRPWTYIGAVPVLAGFVLVMYCASLYRRVGTTIKPFERSSALVTEGPYRYSRNPIYVSLVVMLIGVAVILGSATPWLVVPLFVWSLRAQFIEYEEEALAKQFGDRYAEYCQRVGRWF